MNLPRRQKQLYDLLLGRGDVLIDDLMTGVWGTAQFQRTTQTQQRYLGPYITALNRNLCEHGLKVEPGALKNTYRLVASS